MDRSLDAENYLADFKKSLSKKALIEIAQRAATLSPTLTRAIRVTADGIKAFNFEDALKPPVQRSIVVVENISLAWLSVLGHEWRIDPQFFVRHATQNLSALPPILSEDLESTDAHSGRSQNYWHAHGMIQYGDPVTTRDGVYDPNFFPRLPSKDDDGNLEVNTTTSCFAGEEQYYLLLVDAPIAPPHGGDSIKMRQSLVRFSLSINRGGLSVPMLLGSDKDLLWLFEALQQFFSHAWHLMFLFSPNSRLLDHNIKIIAFNAIRNPSTLLNGQLHDHRENLSHLLKHVAMAKKWMPAKASEELDAIIDQSQEAKLKEGHPKITLENTLQDAQALEKFLIDTFSILLSTIGILEAKTSRQQAKSGQRLTNLAFVYIPLSFVTGVFGMNIREINGSSPSLWAFAIVLVITSLTTFGVIFGSARWRTQQRKH